MQPSATLAMSARARARQAAGHPVISLSAGEPDFDTPAEAAEAAIDAIRAGFTHYTDNKGTLELREAICEKLRRDNGLDYEADRIVCSNGAKQSVAQAVSVLCGPGDEVVIPAPYWVSYPEMVRFAGAEPVVAPTGVEDAYLLSPAKLEAALPPSSRMLILCSPSNPTGSVYSREQLEGLVEVLRRYPDVSVLSDEIYEKIVYDVEHVPIASFPGMKERSITVGGFSKAWAMTGWRLGYLAAEPAVVGAVAKLQSQFTSGPSSISQKAGVAALGMDAGPITAMVDAFRERRDAMLAALAEIDGLRCPVPDGAFYLFPDVAPYLGARTPDGEVIEDTEDLCVYVLEHHDVALVPGHAFGGPTGVRMSYAASMDDLTEAGRRLQRAFASLDRT